MKQGYRMKGDIKGKILFVDNDINSCEIMRSLLEIAGYQVITANILEVFQYARSQYFDFIVLGLYPEDGTAIDLCQWIRYYDQQIPIFFYTDATCTKESKKALEAGAQGYFIKPIDIGNLLQVIKAGNSFSMLR
jgi:DNA-binding response OmpR family regulator